MVHDLVQFIEDREAWDDIMISCFVFSYIRDIYELSGRRVTTGFLYNRWEDDGLPDPSVYCSEGDYVGIEARYLTKEVCDNVHKAGRKVLLYFCYLDGLEDPKYYDFIFSVGVDKIVTSRPIELKAYREEKLRQLRSSNS